MLLAVLAVITVVAVLLVAHQVDVLTVLVFAVEECKCTALHAKVFDQPEQTTKDNFLGWKAVCSNFGLLQLVLEILSANPNVLVLNGSQRY